MVSCHAEPARLQKKSMKGVCSHDYGVVLLKEGALQPETTDGNFKMTSV